MKRSVLTFDSSSSTVDKSVSLSGIGIHMHSNGVKFSDKVTAQSGMQICIRHNKGQTRLCHWGDFV